MSRNPELKGRAARLARLLPEGGRQAARTPFVLLVVLLLGGGLIGLLVLNSALSEGAFQLDDLQKDTKNLTDEEQALQRDIDSYSAPDALQRRARELGMVPGGDPAFLDPDGTVKGVPSAAPAERSSLQDEPVSVLPPEALPTTPSVPSPTDGPLPAAGQTMPSPTLPQSAPVAGPDDSTAPQPATTPTPGR
ncbi:septum formation initiator family protein [Streptomyces sp. MK7]|uniref:septum formation initiator family protein n=1 Tax=Streptomyces sp. MK7 TaxID=3067635 RepID=UPI00292FED66|nr:septum formation initiator family protein [Streptomyces sp. MK7]